MRVLVIGNGGREHALVWKIAQSPQVEKIWCAPGNGGTALLADTAGPEADDLEGLADFAASNAVDLTIVGPEGPLVAGIRNLFDTRGLKLVGPTREAAALEGSKVFAKEFMARHGIPTAPFRVFSDPGEAKRWIRGQDSSLVVKADGLAAGKGVIVCASREEALAAVDRVMVERAFGAAGDRVVIEERLEGPEISMLALVCGDDLVRLAPAMDFKRAYEGDAGPNTGGMGSIAPHALADESLIAEIEKSVLRPTCRGMAEDGIPYEGVLYAGLMMTPSGPQVLEYNCRFGDPETQAILPLLGTDLVDLFLAMVDGRLGAARVEFEQGACICVVVASGGYPGPFEKGKEIAGLEDPSTEEGVVVFHAGTSRKADGRVLTQGGRVLGVTAVGSDFDGASRRVYGAVDRIRFEGMRFRRDIGPRVAEYSGGCA
ncbi:MAG: phosphoribosylamine--glycine ligase [Candidatus Eisenbacteria sp.]|nr:phosphoribosylamine--glycine ligase [Candidatus Eisenbacteria bacterium]